MSDVSLGSGGAVQKLVSEFLELLPEPTQRLVRLSSIPNAINPELLRDLAREEVDADSILEMLQEYYLLNRVEGGWYSFSPATRELLLKDWKQTGQGQEFREANRIAVAFFENLASQTRPPGNYVFQRQALYHRLLADEMSGLAYMAEMFERACDQRQIGAAQNFSMQLAQTLPQLSPVASQHASYYEIRMDFLLNRRKNLKESLETLIEETADPLLRARAGILLGQVLLAQYEWKKSADVLKSSLEQLKKLGAWRYAARAMLALGDVYVDLVENCGGVETGSTWGFSRASQFLSDLLILPLLVLDWFRRRIWFMPGWFYFSGNYQDWILNYLLQMGGRWYGRAWRLAQKDGDDDTSLKALLGQAHVAVQQRREAKARRSYARLARLPAVHSSDYRRAQVLYGQGQVSMLADHTAHAGQELQSALNIFRSFADERNVGRAANTLGKTYLRLADYESAARAFLESFRAYRELQDPLGQTSIAWELDQLVEKEQLTGPLEGQAREALASLQEKHYLARFPSELLHKFRTLAHWVALPLAYMLILFIGGMISLSLIAIESFALEASITGGLSQSTVIFLLLVGILPIPLTFWIIQLIYALVGQVWVVIAGHNSLNTLGEQPDRVIVTAEALVLDRPGLNETVHMDWQGLDKVVSADFRLWQRPIHLLSRLGLVAGSKSISIEGITSGYMQLRREIMQRVAATVGRFNADLVVLAHRSTYITVLFAALHAQLLVSLGLIAITVENEETGTVIPLVLSRLLVFFIVNLIMLFPPLLLWRIYLQRRFFERQLGIDPKGFHNLLRLSAVILLSILAILWLVLSPIIEVGDEDASPAANTLPQVLLTGTVMMDRQPESVTSASKK